MAKFKAKAFKSWLDSLCSAMVKARDNYTCQVCGKVVSGHNCQWSHIKSRKWNSTRWMPENSMVKCGYCHRWWHDNPAEAGKWFSETFPERYKKIYSAKGKSSWKQWDFEEVEKELLELCLTCNVDYDTIAKTYQKRYIKAIKNLKESS